MTSYSLTHGDAVTRSRAHLPAGGTHRWGNAGTETEIVCRFLLVILLIDTIDIYRLYRFYMIVYRFYMIFYRCFDVDLTFDVENLQVMCSLRDGPADCEVDVGSSGYSQISPFSSWISH